jgi:hypothetical protein
MEEVKKTITKDVPMPNKSNWHFICTKPAAEKKVFQKLSTEGHQVFFPY